MEGDDEQIRVKDKIPADLQSVFPFEYFNEMQSALLKQVYDSDVNMTVAAPTGSGKTVVCELAILRLLKKYRITELKCIMITPNKALCQQKMKEWNKGFGQLGLSVLELTGDSFLQHSLRLVARANIIITTPEKWDCMTRSWRQHVFLLGAIDLLIIDEIHHLGEDNRGATLEAVIVRMRTLNNIYQEKVPQGNVHRTPMRIVSLSAALPNVSDIGEWLQCGAESIHYFDETFRPIPLTVHSIAYGSIRNMFLFERSLDNKVEDVIKRFSDGKQSLIFCASKSGCERLSQLLSQRFTSCANPGAYSSSSAVSQLQNTKLRDLVRRGHGFHHAGIPADDRVLVEQLFTEGKIHVLCATSTLAHGVNLPAHLVVIKGTNQWRGGSKGYQKMSKSMILQMTGRAGRPGFDTFGTAVIMTSNEDKEYFSNIDLDVVESTLPSILTETICAEVSQRVIQTTQDCVDWLKNTFFYLRVKLNPTRYGFSSQFDDGQLDELLVEMCVRSLESLKEADVVEYSDHISIGTGDVVTVKALPPALIMTKHMIKLATMSALMKIASSGTIYDVLATISKADEVAKPVLRSEKKVLNEMMKNTRFPLKLKVQEPFHKAYVLLMSAVYKNKFDSFNVTVEQNRSHSVYTDFALRVQQSEIVEQSLRLLSALFDFSLEESRGRVILSCLYVMRALKLQIWEKDFHVFDQCPDMPFMVIDRLRRENIHDIDDVLSVPSNELQKLLRCTRETLQVIYDYSKKEKCSALVASFEPTYSKHDQLTSFEVIISPRIAGSSDMSKFQSFFQSRRLFHLVVYDLETSVLLCYRKFYSSLERNRFNVTLSNQFERDEGRCQKRVCVSLLCDATVGQDFVTEYPSCGEIVSVTKPILSTGTGLSCSSDGDGLSVRGKSQTLLSFPSSSKKKKRTETGDQGDALPHSLSDSASASEIVNTAAQAIENRKSTKAKSAGQRKKAKKLSDNSDSLKKSPMFGIFEYKPLRDQDSKLNSSSCSNSRSHTSGTIDCRSYQKSNIPSQLPQFPHQNHESHHTHLEQQQNRSFIGAPTCEYPNSHSSDLQRPERCASRKSGAARLREGIGEHCRADHRCTSTPCGGSAELNLMRSKASELRLDQTPIQQACRRVNSVSQLPCVGDHDATLGEFAEHAPYDEVHELVETSANASDSCRSRQSLTPYPSVSSVNYPLVYRTTPAQTTNDKRFLAYPPRDNENTSFFNQPWECAEQSTRAFGNSSARSPAENVLLGGDSLFPKYRTENYNTTIQGSEFNGYPNAQIPCNNNEALYQLNSSIDCRRSHNFVSDSSSSQFQHRGTCSAAGTQEVPKDANKQSAAGVDLFEQGFF